jgi:hemerythrin-like domain-containing protein
MIRQKMMDKDYNMKPIGILMREHRIIERMLALLGTEKESMKVTGKIHIDFLTATVDFFRMYSDKIHHGKEEDILFHRLSTKPLSIEHRRTISQLMDDHMTARSFIRTLDGARDRYIHNSPGAILEIIGTIERMQMLYTAHIETEDKHFFYPAMDYFSDEERAQMIQDFFEYDQTVNKEKYESMVKQSETSPPVIMKKIFDT